MWLAIANSKEGDKEQHLVKKKFKTLGMVEIQFKDKMGSNCNSNSIIVVDYNINNKNNGNNTIKVIGGWNSGSYNIVISS